MLVARTLVLAIHLYIWSFIVYRGHESFGGLRELAYYHVIVTGIRNDLRLREV